MSSVKDRIHQLIDAKERMCLVLDYTGLNANSLSQKIGLPKYRLYDITQGRTKAVTYEIADKITSSFTTISKDWLLTGEGSMLLSDNPNSMKYSVKEFRVRHELTQKEMSDLLGVSPRMVQKYESGESPLPEDKQMRMELFEGSRASTGEGVAKETSSLTSSDVVRYYPNIPATAGDIENMPEPSYEDQQPIIYVIPGLGGCDAMPATGNSMYPTITAGDMVVHKVWQDGSYIRNGEIYVILTTDGQRMIKRLTYVSTDEEGYRHYVCRSDNPDQDKYAPFELLGSTIRQLSIVKAILTRIE